MTLHGFKNHEAAHNIFNQLTPDVRTLIIAYITGFLVVLALSVDFDAAYQIFIDNQPTQNYAH